VAFVVAADLVMWESLEEHQWLGESQKEKSGRGQMGCAQIAKRSLA
jgi:hypothetical protein